ncbi:hypothetical protein D3C71_1483300 [compost metagenome]
MLQPLPALCFGRPGEHRRFRRFLARLLTRQCAGVGGQVQQGDRLASVISRYVGTGRGVFAQRIGEFDPAFRRHFYHHFAGHQLGDRGDADQGIRARTQVVTGFGVAKTAVNHLIAVDHHQRHAGGAAVVENVLGILVDDLRSQLRGSGLRGQRRGTQAQRQQ